MFSPCCGGGGAGACCEGGAARARKIEILEASSLFVSLEPVALRALARYMRLRQFKRSEVLFERGADAVSLFVVGAGSVRLSGLARQLSTHPLQPSEWQDVMHAIHGASGSPHGGASESSGASPTLHLRGATPPESGSADATPRPAELVAVRSAGAFIGQSNFFKDEVVSQPLSAVALTPCEVVKLSRAAFAKFVAAAPALEAGVRRAFGDSIERHLRELPLFQSVSPEHTSVLASLLHVVPLEEGEVLFHEGHPGSSLFIIYAGQVTAISEHRTAGADADPLAGSSPAPARKPTAQPPGVVPRRRRRPREEEAAVPTKKAGVGRHTVLNVFEAGSFFGEISLLVDIPRTATMVADERSLLLELRKRDFEALLRLSNDHMLAHNVNDLMKRRAAEGFRRFPVSFFKAIPESKFAKLGAASVIRSYAAGEWIVREGEPGDSFFLIMHGRCRVCSRRKRGEVPSVAQHVMTAPVGTGDEDELKRRDDEDNDGGGDGGGGDMVELNVLTSGSFFGEIALVSRRPRTASVQALTRVVAIVVDRESFDAFMAETPEALAEFKLQMEMYDVQLSTLLDHTLGIQYFRQYLATEEHSEENLAFVLAVSAFRRRYGRSAARSTGSWSMGSSGLLGSHSTDSRPHSLSANLHSIHEERRLREDADEDLLGGEADDAFHDAEMPESGRDEACAIEALEIVEQYIRPEAPFEVNLPAFVRRTVMQDVQQRPVPTNLFDSAFIEIRKLLQQHSFPRFKCSALFQQFLASYVNS